MCINDYRTLKVAYFNLRVYHQNTLIYWYGIQLFLIVFDITLSNLIGYLQQIAYKC